MNPLERELLNLLVVYMLESNALIAAVIADTGLLHDGCYTLPREKREEVVAWKMQEAKKIIRKRVLSLHAKYGNQMAFQELMKLLGQE